MKLRVLAVAAMSVLTLAACQQESSTTTPQTQEASQVTTIEQLTTEEQKQAYGLGQNIGLYINKQFALQEDLGISLDKELVVKGFVEAVNGTNLFTEAETNQFVNAVQTQIQAKQREKAESEGQANLEAGRAYLEENSKREGVITTESGIQYEVLTEGDGAKPTAADTVKVHYQGTLIDGTEFDSSYSRGQPIEFPLNGVIKGWTEGVQLMSIGSKYRFHIPSELAYGARATGKIGAYSTLIFEVELLDITTAE